LGKTSTDQSQAAWNKQCPAYSLQAPGYDQLVDVGCQPAPGRGYREEHYPGDEDFAAAIPVSQRAADEKQRRQKERVRFHDPLNLGNRRAQRRLQRRQRHIHDRAIDESHARAQDCCSQNPRAVGWGGLLTGTGKYRAFVAGSSGDYAHNPFSDSASVLAPGPILPDPISAIQNRDWKSQLDPACKSAFEVPRTPTLQFESGLQACDPDGARTVKDELAQLEMLGQWVQLCMLDRARYPAVPLFDLNAKIDNHGRSSFIYNTREFSLPPAWGQFSDAGIGAAYVVRYRVAIEFMRRAPGDGP
jgi:hypothetical protein